MQCLRTMTKNPHQLELIPPYCPNSVCPFHFGSDSKFYVKNGFAVTDKPPFRNQRFKCSYCQIQFSANTFELDFRRRKVGVYENVLHYAMNGMSNNSIGRLLKINEGTIRNRLRELARQALFVEKENYPTKITEDVAYDGFETFTHSQYSPCYINTVVGSKSMFVYHNTLSPLNRKGRMTDEQKIMNRDLIKKHGLYPQSSVFEETIYILKNISAMGTGRTLYTDEHKSYGKLFAVLIFRWITP